MNKYLNILGVKFVLKEESVPYHNRLTYKTTVMLLILLKCCRGRGCSVSKFHLIMNHIHSDENQRNLLSYVWSEQSFVYLRHDSTVIRALEFMGSDGLIEIQKNSSFKLTPKGKKIAIMIWDDLEVFLFEKNFLRRLGNSLTEDLVKKISNSLSSI